MPTVLRVGPYAFVFFSSDRGEPRHVHVKRDKQIAKFWLEPVSLAKNMGFSQQELRDLEKLVQQNQALLVRGWNDFFGP